MRESRLRWVRTHPGRKLSPDAAYRKKPRLQFLYKCIGMGLSSEDILDSGVMSHVVVRDDLETMADNYLAMVDSFSAEEGGFYSQTAGAKAVRLPSYEFILEHWDSIPCDYGDPDAWRDKPYDGLDAAQFVKVVAADAGHPLLQLGPAAPPAWAQHREAQAALPAAVEDHHLGARLFFVFLGDRM